MRSLTFICVLIVSSSVLQVRAHEPHACDPLFPGSPVIPGHIEHSDAVSGHYSASDLFEIGKELFEAPFNICDGQGRPATTGTGAKRDPDEPAFIRTSAPDANSCSGCHNLPRTGGAGEFVANVFVLAQAEDPVQESVNAQFSNDRNTLGMFGAGAIEMLAREMTAELQAQKAAAGDGEHTFYAKGVPFDVQISGGNVVAAEGVDLDLVIKPFHQAGVVTSIREFTVNAMNHHHGMQADERFADPDFDEDGVEHELTVGDISAVTLFQAGLAIPGQMLPAGLFERDQVEQGEAVFAALECTSCHVPAMTLDSRHFVEPNPFNPAGTFSDTSQSVSFDMTKDGEKPQLEKGPDGGAIVRAYTDLKRHNLCDPLGGPVLDPIRYYCNEQLAQGRPDQNGLPGEEFFLTRKLWDVGNSAPYGHRGDLTTIAEAIYMHGGEARESRDAFANSTVDDQAALVLFLKSLQVLPPGSPAVVLEGCGRSDCGESPEEPLNLASE